MRRAARRLAVPVVAVGLAASWIGVLPATAAPAAAAPSDGCGQPHAGGISEETIESAGAARAYRLAVPENSTGEKPLPLILNFHGFGSNAIQQAIYSQLEEKGPERGYIVLTPEGTGGAQFWNIFPDVEAPDDVAYTAELIDTTAAALCINTDRVYSTGISNGGGISAYLGCHLGERLAAIAPVAGVNLAQGDCPDAEGVSMIAFHGEADATVPYAGSPEGGTSLGGRPQLPVEDAVAEWAEIDGCKRKPRVRAVSEHVEFTDYSGCDKKTDVQLYSVSDGGHTWPGSLDVPRLGHVTTEINAADLMLDFFDEHTRR